MKRLSVVQFNPKDGATISVPAWMTVTQTSTGVVVEGSDPSQDYGGWKVRTYLRVEFTYDGHYIGHTCKKTEAGEYGKKSGTPGARFRHSSRCNSNWVIKWLAEGAT